MKKSIDLKNLILGALVGAAIVFSVGAVTGAGKRTAWEYTARTYASSVPDVTQANQLGEEGWELVCSTPPFGQGGGMGIGLIFKRQK